MLIHIYFGYDKEMCGFERVHYGARGKIANIIRKEGGEELYLN